MAEVRLCAMEELEEGEAQQVTVAGHTPFAAYRVGGGVYVSDDSCTHSKASLGDEGDLDGFTITCTWHDGAFDIRTGEVKALPCIEKLKVYPVTIRDGEVFISID